MWFSFDGESFQTHNTEQEAKDLAELAMQDWQDRAGDGWDDQSTQVCYGKVTHAVRVEEIEITEENSHLVPPGCEGAENHFLEPIGPATHDCNICGGSVQFTGGKPVAGMWGHR